MGQTDANELLTLSALRVLSCVHGVRMPVSVKKRPFGQKASLGFKRLVCALCCIRKCAQWLIFSVLVRPSMPAIYFARGVGSGVRIWGGFEKRRRRLRPLWEAQLVLYSPPDTLDRLFIAVGHHGSHLLGPESANSPCVHQLSV